MFFSCLPFCSYRCGHGRGGGVATKFLQWPSNRIYSILSRKDLLILLLEIWVWS